MKRVWIKVAFAVSDTVVWHSGYPWTVLAAQRRWSRSTVVIMGSSGESFTGPFRQGIRVAHTWLAGYRMLHFIARKEHTMVRADDYQFLLSCCRREIPIHEAESLLVSDLWRMWGISARECAPSIHTKNKKFIIKQLRWRGITINPESRFRVKLPAGCAATKVDVVAVLRRALKHSYLPLVICDHILKTADVVKYASPTLAERLDNGRGWSRLINDCEEVE